MIINLFNWLVLKIRNIFPEAKNSVIKSDSENDSNNAENTSQKETQNSQNATINNGMLIVNPLEKNTAAEAILKQVILCKDRLKNYKSEEPKNTDDIPKSFKKDISKLDTSITINAKLFDKNDQKELKKRVSFLRNLDVSDKESLPSQEVFQPIENILSRYKTTV